MTTSVSISNDRSLSLVESRPRATAPDSGQRFREALAGAAGAAVSGLGTLLPFGSGALSTVIATPSAGRTATTTAGLTAGTSDSPGLARESADQAVELLALQQQIGLEQRQFTTVSNVMKARHDTAKNVVGNFR